MINKEKLSELISEYMNHFPKHWENEKFKWEAIKIFHDNWDIDAEDFIDMFMRATEKTYGLLASVNSFPRGMIKSFATYEPQTVRQMFIDLFDERKSVTERIDQFRKSSDELRAKHDDIWQSHYQTENAITTYLWLMYPDKYYIYKYSEVKAFTTELESDFAPKKGKALANVEGSFKLYDEVREIIKKDVALNEMLNNALTETCYSDPERITLTIDLEFFVSRYYKKNEVDDSAWFPSDYSPNLTVEDWMNVLQDSNVFNDKSLLIMKRMLDIGGEATCTQLANKYGETKNFYNVGSSSLGKRIAEKTGCPLYDGPEANSKYWPILYVGRSADKEQEGSWIFKLRSELKEALERMDLHSVEYKHDKNMILYGPPGTGKTYHTAIYAVAICEGKSVESYANVAYEEILAKYKALKENGRIAFTTFHQSYGYEDFIEGIYPDVDTSDEDVSGDVKYKIKSGVFKEFCETASIPVLNNQDNLGLNKNPVIWKVSLEKTGENETRRECLKNGHIRIGWDEYGPEITENTKYTSGGSVILDAFINQMKTGDIVVSCFSQYETDAIGVVTGDYEWDGKFDYYNRVRKVKWLVKDIRENILEFNNNKPMTLSSVYKLKMSLADVLGIVKKYRKEKEPTKNNNYVFIIDEINRGNISKIFGELITLIEPTKRKGEKEELEAMLPYTRKLFSVPSNVYILGTMNTADRSIALMDTALRRRFQFIEMMPDSQILRDNGADKVSDGENELDVADMLDKINERITFLYDREHTIGHAFFMGLKDEPTVEKLSSVFAKSVIPLLQEYFYEDYQKIQLVLGDNGKQNEELKFISDKKISTGAVFKGVVEDYIDIPERHYELNKKALENIQSYIEII